MFAIVLGLFLMLVGAILYGVARVVIWWHRE